jgi:hypothetical protein
MITYRSPYKYFVKPTKNLIKSDCRKESPHGKQRETQRKAKRHAACKNQRRERERLALLIGKYHIHSPSNVVCKQIMRSNNNNKRSKTNISSQLRLPFYGES